MGTDVDTHLTGELLERYSLRQVSEEEGMLVEEHILLCEQCQEKLQETDEFVQAFRIAAPKVAVERQGNGKSLRGTVIGWMVALSAALSSGFRPLPMAGLAALVALVWMIPREPVVMQARVLELRAIRSVEGGMARTWEPLTLRLDVEGLADEPYEVEIAGMGGDTVWSGQAKATDGVVAVSPGALRKAGLYWVRVLGSDAGRPLLREYKLEVRGRE